MSKTRIDVRCDPELKKAAEEKALAEGKNLSQVIRDYLKRYVAKRSK